MLALIRISAEWPASSASTTNYKQTSALEDPALDSLIVYGIVVRINAKGR